MGEVELGASALAGIIYIAIYTLGFGFSMGSQILIGRRNGEKNYNQIGDIVIQGALFCFCHLYYSFLFKIRCCTLVPAIFESAEVGRAVAEYLEWRVFGLVFAFINLMFRAFFIGIARTKILTLNALIMGLVNVIFDYGLIFGNLGMPELGIGGAAVASVIAEIASTLFFLFYLRKKVDLNKYGFTKIRFQFDVIKNT